MRGEAFPPDRTHPPCCLLSISSNKMYIQLCLRTYQRRVVRSHRHHYLPTAQPAMQAELSPKPPLLSVSSLINIMKKPTKTPTAKSLFTTKDVIVPCVC